MLKVSDETIKATLTLFDQEAQKLLNTTTQILLQQQANTSIPSILKNLCHRTLIFEIKLYVKKLKRRVTNLHSIMNFYTNCYSTRINSKNTY